MIKGHRPRRPGLRRRARGGERGGGGCGEQQGAAGHRTHHILTFVSHIRVSHSRPAGRPATPLRNKLNRQLSTAAARGVLIAPQRFSKLLTKNRAVTAIERRARSRPMIKTKGVLHITIPVSDLDRAKAFYTDVLGLEFIAQAPKDDPHFVFLKSGADYVVLGRETRRERFSDIIHHAFMVDGDAYDATVAELKAKGVDVFREDERHEGVFTGRSAYFHDPDSNALEVIHLTNAAKR